MKLLSEIGWLFFFKKFHIKIKINRNCYKEEQRSLATKSQNTSLPGMFIQDKMFVNFAATIGTKVLGKIWVSLDSKFIRH